LPRLRMSDLFSPSPLSWSSPTGPLVSLWICNGCFSPLFGPPRLPTRSSSVRGKRGLFGDRCEFGFPFPLIHRASAIPFYPIRLPRQLASFETRIRLNRISRFFNRTDLIALFLRLPPAWWGRWLSPHCLVISSHPGCIITTPYEAKILDFFRFIFSLEALYTFPLVFPFSL